MTKGIQGLNKALDLKRMVFPNDNKIQREWNKTLNNHIQRQKILNTGLNMQGSSQRLNYKQTPMGLADLRRANQYGAQSAPNLFRGAELAIRAQLGLQNAVKGFGTQLKWQGLLMGKDLASLGNGFRAASNMLNEFTYTMSAGLQIFRLAFRETKKYVTEGAAYEDSLFRAKRTFSMMENKTGRKENAFENAKTWVNKIARDVNMQRSETELWNLITIPSMFLGGEEFKFDNKTMEMFGKTQSMNVMDVSKRIAERAMDIQTMFPTYGNSEEVVRRFASFFAGNYARAFTRYGMKVPQTLVKEEYDRLTKGKAYTAIQKLQIKNLIALNLLEKQLMGTVDAAGKRSMLFNSQLSKFDRNIRQLRIAIMAANLPLITSFFTNLNMFVSVLARDTNLPKVGRLMLLITGVVGSGILLTAGKLMFDLIKTTLGFKSLALLVPGIIAFVIVMEDLLAGLKGATSWSGFFIKKFGELPTIIGFVTVAFGILTLATGNWSFILMGIVVGIVLLNKYLPKAAMNFTNLNIGIKIFLGALIATFAIMKGIVLFNAGKVIFVSLATHLFFATGALTTFNLALTGTALIFARIFILITAIMAVKKLGEEFGKYQEANRQTISKVNMGDVLRQKRNMPTAVQRENESYDSFVARRAKEYGEFKPTNNIIINTNTDNPNRMAETLRRALISGAMGMQTGYGIK